MYSSRGLAGPFSLPPRLASDLALALAGCFAAARAPDPSRPISPDPPAARSRSDSSSASRSARSASFSSLRRPQRLLQFVRDEGLFPRKDSGGQGAAERGCLHPVGGAHQHPGCRGQVAYGDAGVGEFLQVVDGDREHQGELHESGAGRLLGGGLFGRTHLGGRACLDDALAGRGHELGAAPVGLDDTGRGGRIDGPVDQGDPLAPGAGGGLQHAAQHRGADGAAGCQGQHPGAETPESCW